MQPRRSHRTEPSGVRVVPSALRRVTLHTYSVVNGADAAGQTISCAKGCTRSAAWQVGAYLDQVRALAASAKTMDHRRLQRRTHASVAFTRQKKSSASHKYINTKALCTLHATRGLVVAHQHGSGCTSEPTRLCMALLVARLQVEASSGRDAVELASESVERCLSTGQGPGSSASSLR